MRIAMLVTMTRLLNSRFFSGLLTLREGDPLNNSSTSAVLAACDELNDPGANVICERR
jgi:hypothetical protein